MPRGVVVAVVVVGVAAGAWLVTGLRPFTVPSLVAVLAAGVVAMAVGRWTGRRGADARRPAPHPGVGAGGHAGVVAWAVVLAAVAGWELAAYLQHPRVEHPTLSWLVDGVLDPHPVRAAAFVAWLAGAWELARR